jgi:3-deoxy-D-manno-octulosonate 8-phosphate phosphatase KdsC-like HAD superfamily phosphatase
MKITTFISDVDGCLNDGVIYWDRDGQKPFKAFGNYDHDGVKLLREHVKIVFISADKHGWDILKSRIVDHMKCELHYVPESQRYAFVEQYGFDNIAYMGDGIYDAKIIFNAAIGIAPAQARIEARESASHVTPSRGGEGAYLDACVHIMKKIGIPYEF